MEVSGAIVVLLAYILIFLQCYKGRALVLDTPETYFLCRFLQIDI